MKIFVLLGCSIVNKHLQTCSYNHYCFVAYTNLPLWKCVFFIDSFDSIHSQIYTIACCCMFVYIQLPKYLGLTFSYVFFSFYLLIYSIPLTKSTFAGQPQLYHSGGLERKAGISYSLHHSGKVRVHYMHCNALSLNTD